MLLINFFIHLPRSEKCGWLSHEQAKVMEASIKNWWSIKKVDFGVLELGVMRATFHLG